MSVNYEQEQRSLDWYRSRLGFITGSKISVIIGKGRAKDAVFTQTGYKYLYQVAAERALSTSIVDDDIMFQYYLDQTSSQSKAMKFGIEQEPEARDLYTTITGIPVTEVGLCQHANLKFLASSPDGMVEENGEIGNIEIKCPTISTFAEYCANIHDNDSLKSVEVDYYYQCMNHMACTGAKFCDFVAYCPFMENPMHIVRIKRDDEVIAAMIERATLAEEFIQSIVQSLTKKKDG